MLELHKQILLLEQLNGVKDTRSAAAIQESLMRELFVIDMCLKLLYCPDTFRTISAKNPCTLVTV